MTRFVDEERINSGTLKALGYDNQDIMKKFIFYGLVSGLSGAIIGIILGHTLMPIIVYNAYRSGFTVPKIEFHFHLGVTLVALLLAIVSSVLPAWLVAKREHKQMQPIYWSLKHLLQVQKYYLNALRLSGIGWISRIR